LARVGDHQNSGKGNRHGRGRRRVGPLETARFRPPARRRSTAPEAGPRPQDRIAASCMGATATGLNATGAGVRLQSCCRHRNSWLVCIPASRATSEATTPGSSAAATIRSFSARDHRRRRCTDVITSTCVLVRSTPWARSDPKRLCGLIESHCRFTPRPHGHVSPSP
jgi:hypothetical protein